MTNDEAMTVTLQWHHTRFVLEALQELEKNWLEINRTSTNEDEQADYGNALMSLRGAKDFLEREATKTFGPGVVKFSRQPFAPAIAPNGEHPQPPR